MRLLKLFASVLFLVVIFYLIGPQPKVPDYNNQLPTIPTTVVALEKYIAASESTHKVKPNNEARIIWANDSLKQKTKYAIVYLHGFSASQEEGSPDKRRISVSFSVVLTLFLGGNAHFPSSA